MITAVVLGLGWRGLKTPASKAIIAPVLEVDSRDHARAAAAALSVKTASCAR